MGRTRSGARPDPLDMLDGVLVVDKPEGPSSHDVVAVIRRATAQQRVGHTGTLDPMATGVLPIVLGRATRLSRFLAAGSKRYRAVVRLGRATATYDATGETLGTPAGESAVAAVTSADVERTLGQWRGALMQTPPPFSAKKIAGVRAYALARADREPRPEPAAVMVHELRLVGLAEGRVEIDLACSAGFYVRSLAHDLGQALGIGGHLEALRRTSSGAFTLDGSVGLAGVVEGGREAIAGAMLPLDRLLTEWPGARLTEEGLRRAARGLDVRREDVSAWLAADEGAGRPGGVRLLGPDGRLMAIACDALAGAPILHPDVVLV
jgi:tRNA pseudouridine55 synthase